MGQPVASDVYQPPHERLGRLGDLVPLLAQKLSVIGPLLSEKVANLVEELRQPVDEHRDHLLKPGVSLAGILDWNGGRLSRGTRRWCYGRRGLVVGRVR